MAIYKIYNGEIASLLVDEKDIIQEKEKLKRIKKKLLRISQRNLTILIEIQEICNKAQDFNNNVLEPNLDWINEHEDIQLIKEYFDKLCETLNKSTIESLLSYYKNLRDDAFAADLTLDLDIKNHKTNIYKIIGETNKTNLYETEIRSLRYFASQLEDTINKLETILENLNPGDNTNPGDDTEPVEPTVTISFSKSEIYIFGNGYNNGETVQVNVSGNPNLQITSLSFTGNRNASGRIICKSEGNNRFTIYVRNGITNITYETSVYVPGYPSIILPINVGIIPQSQSNDNNYYIGLTTSSKTSWSLSDMTEFSYIGITSFTAEEPGSSFNIMVVPTATWGTLTSMKVDGMRMNPWQTPVPWITSLPSGYTSYFTKFGGDVEITDIVWTK